MPLFGEFGPTIEGMYTPSRDPLLIVVTTAPPPIVPDGGPSMGATVTRHSDREGSGRLTGAMDELAGKIGPIVGVYQPDRMIKWEW